MTHLSNTSLRLKALSKLNIDFNEKSDYLDRLTKATAFIGNAEYCFINIHDENTQWTISSYGINFPHIPRKESICKLTIKKDDVLEIPDLTKDPRYCDKDYVTGEPYLRYYIGSPIRTSDGITIGSLCLLDTKTLSMSPEQIEMMAVLSKQTMSYLELRSDLAEKSYIIKAQQSAIRKINHDIRTPLTGIVGSISLLEEDSSDTTLKTLLPMIKDSCFSLIEYSENLLEQSLSKHSSLETVLVTRLIDKLKSLYTLQANSKNITLNFKTKLPDIYDVDGFNLGSLINIIGNTISNSIKYSPENSEIQILLDKTDTDTGHYFRVKVKDIGVGMSDEQRIKIMDLETLDSTIGTKGEKGFGFGLTESFKYLKEHGGHFEIESTLGEGTTITLMFYN